MKLKDVRLLKEVIAEIKKLPKLVGIVQTGSSLFSEKYKDIDILVFFSSILPPPMLKIIAEKYRKHRFSIEGIFGNITPSRKVFIKFFKNSKAKKILFGKNPYEKFKLRLNKADVAAYINNYYWLANTYGKDYDNVLSRSLNALLAYKNIFPKKKFDILLDFKKAYPQLAKFLPKNVVLIVKNTRESDFPKLYDFFEKTMEYLYKKK